MSCSKFLQVVIAGSPAVPALMAESRRPPAPAIRHRYCPERKGVQTTQDGSHNILTYDHEDGVVVESRLVALQIVLHVHTANEKAMAFYLQHGFSIVGMCVQPITDTAAQQLSDIK